MHEKTLGSEQVFEGRLLNVEVLDVELASGVRSVREILRHPGAAVILPELPDGRFVFVRQYRKAIEKVLLEAVAGTLHAGEQPEACAERELEEETGYRATALTPLGAIVSAPGYTNERLHVFHAAVDPRAHATRTDADEELEVVIVSADDFERRIAAGEIEDAKTLAAWLLFERRLNANAREGGSR